MPTDLPQRKTRPLVDSPTAVNIMIAVFAAMLLAGLGVSYIIEPRAHSKSSMADQQYVPAVSANDWRGAFRHAK